MTRRGALRDVDTLLESLVGKDVATAREPSAWAELVRRAEVARQRVKTRLAQADDEQG